MTRGECCACLNASREALAQVNGRYLKAGLSPITATEMRDARMDIKETQQSLLDPTDEQLRRWRREAAKEEARP